MEEIMLAIKYVLFYGMEVVVVAIFGITLIAGLYELVHDKLVDLWAVSPKEPYRSTERK